MLPFPTNDQAATAWTLFIAVAILIGCFKIANWAIDQSQMHDCVERNMGLGAHWQIAERLCEQELRK